MKKISLKRLLAFTSIAIVLLISILSQIDIDSYSISCVMDNGMQIIADGSIVFVIAYILLGAYDLFKDSKRSGIIDLICAGAFAILHQSLSFYYYLWEDLEFIIPFIIYAIFTNLNVIEATKNHKEKNIVTDIIVSIALFAICSGIIFIPVMRIKTINKENLDALIENKDAIWEGEDTNYYLTNTEYGQYDILDEKLEKDKSINAILAKYRFIHIYNGQKSSMVGIGIDSKDEKYYVYNNCFDKVCQLESFKLLYDYKIIVDNSSYLIELLTQAQKNGMIDFGNIKELKITDEEYIYDDLFADGSEIFYKDDEYYGYIDTEGYRHINEKNEYIVNMYDKYIVTYKKKKNHFEIMSKENKDIKIEYDFVMPYKNFMICYKKDHYEILDTEDLDVLLKVNVDYSEDYGRILASDFLSDELVKVYGDESVIVLDGYDEDGGYSKILIRFNKEEKIAEVVTDEIEVFDSWDTPQEFPNSLYYLYTDIFEVEDYDEKSNIEKIEDDINELSEYRNEEE